MPGELGGGRADPDHQAHQLRRDDRIRPAEQEGDDERCVDLAAGGKEDDLVRVVDVGGEIFLSIHGESLIVRFHRNNGIRQLVGLHMKDQVGVDDGPSFECANLMEGIFVKFSEADLHFHQYP